MKRTLFTAMTMLLLVGSVPYSVAELPSGNEASSQLQTATDPLVCPAAGLVLLNEGLPDFDLIHRIDRICRADCLEDFHACTISLPLSYCRSLYDACISNC